MAVSVEVVVDVTRGDHHHLTVAHGAHLDIGQEGVTQWVPEDVQSDQLLNKIVKEYNQSFRR